MNIRCINERLSRITIQNYSYDVSSMLSSSSSNDDDDDGRIQCDQIGDFWKFLGTIFLTKVAQILSDSLGL